MTSLDENIRYLQRRIDAVKLKKGNFATSVTVNENAFLESEQLYQDVAQHFRNLGYTVHAPPSAETFQLACDNHARDEMSLIRWNSAPEALSRMILVEIPLACEQKCT